MKKLRPARLFLLSILVATYAFALETPNFNGTWVSEDNPARTVTITQDEALLTDTDGRNTITYRLDGSESRSEITTAHGDKWAQVSTAKWIGYALVITTTTTRETGQSWDSLKIYTLGALPNCTSGAGSNCGAGTLKVTTVDEALAGPYMVVSAMIFDRKN